MAGKDGSSDPILKGASNSIILALCFAFMYGTCIGSLLAYRIVNLCYIGILVYLYLGKFFLKADLS